MARLIDLTFAALSVLIIETSALSYLNGSTVSSDILTKLFMNGIQWNQDFVDTPVKRNVSEDSLKCMLALQEIVNRFPEMDVLPFLDAWGRIPSGLLHGHIQDLGNFDQCVHISKVLSQAAGHVNGQYCFVSLPLVQTEIPESSKTLLEMKPRDVSSEIEDFLAISIGICIPDTCEPEFITNIFQQASNNFLNGSLSGISVNRCKTNDKPRFEAVNILGIVIFSIFGAFLTCSTLYDIYTNYFERTPVPILLAFSVLRNGKKLFAINTLKSPNSIDCLLGIRVLSMAWVLYCHNYIFVATVPTINFIDIIPWLKAASSMHVLMATVSVDTFLFMSGLLIAWLGLRELDRSKGKLNVVMMYVHRYIRLTPPLAALILYAVSIQQYVGTGPLSDTFNVMFQFCETNWWSTLLYVQNYVNPNEICISPSWYLAVDTQLYILSPLLLIALWKWGPKFAPVMVILAALSIGCVIATYFTEGYTGFIGTLGNNQRRLTYTPSHTRYTVWLVGIGLGYAMHKNRERQFIPSKTVQRLAWIVSLVSILAIIYGPYFTMNSNRSSTVLEAALYESFRRVSWAIALSWIVFACHFGVGGLINTFLSHPLWQPFARLTFSLYLVHMIVQYTIYGTSRTDMYFSNYNEILNFWSTFGVSLMAATLLTLTFESPILVIEKILLGNGKQKKPLKHELR